MLLWPWGLLLYKAGMVLCGKTGKALPEQLLVGLTFVGGPMEGVIYYQISWYTTYHPHLVPRSRILRCGSMAPLIPKVIHCFQNIHFDSGNG